jgi:hypothetical protein
MFGLHADGTLPVLSQDTPQLLRLELPTLEFSDLTWLSPHPAPLGPGEHSITLDAGSFIGAGRLRALYLESSTRSSYGTTPSAVQRRH